jgi:hypothetical protein
MNYLRKLFLVVFIFFFSSEVKSQTSFYYFGKNNIQDTPYIKPYFSELGSRLKSDAFLLMDISKAPVLCEGKTIDACMASQLKKSTDFGFSDSAALSIMVQKVNQIKNPINNIDFYFFVNEACSVSVNLNQFVHKLLLATSLYGEPTTTVYFLTKDLAIKEKFVFIKSNKNSKQFQLKQY